MKNMSKDAPILVTGGSGYIASWVIKMLLDDGYLVHATVRDASQQEKIAHLTALQKSHTDKLRLYNADLLKDGSFAEAMQGCELVIHTASPFQIEGIKDPQKELIDPALQGTRNVLASANDTPSVKRVVQTSSCAAIYGDAADGRALPNGVFTEDIWNTSSSLTNSPYAYSKTLAEQEGWTMMKAQSRWDLVVINPGFVFGPSLSRRKDSTSIGTMRSFLNGRFKFGAPDLYFPVVDVRDVAKAHILAGTKPAAGGRHILCAEVLSFLDMAALLRKHYPDYPLPKKPLPKAMLYLVGPFMGFSWKFISENIGISMKFDNRYSKQDLGLEYTPPETSLRDHAEQIMNDGLV